MPGLRANLEMTLSAQGIANLLRQPFTGGHFQLAFDGAPICPAYVKSVEGGLPKANLVDEPVGHDNMHIKHVSTVEIEPLSAELGLADADDILAWIKGSWDKSWSRRSGMVSYADFNQTAQFEQDFRDALITECVFPTLDASAKEGTFLKIKWLPEAVDFRRASGMPKHISFAGGRQKMYVPSAFSFQIDGLDLRSVSKVENIQFKQGVKTLHTGIGRFAQIEPTKIEFPDISFHMPLQYADPVLKWYEEFVIKGKRDPECERTGCIEFLSPDRGGLLFRIDLYNVGIRSVTLSKGEAQNDQLKRVKFDIYVGGMKMDGKAGGPLSEVVPPRPRF